MLQWLINLNTLLIYCSRVCLQPEGGAVCPAVQRCVGSVRYPPGGSRHGASVCTPAAPRVHCGEHGAGLHRADGRGLPPAPAHAGRPATPGDPGTEWKQADQNGPEGADRCPEGQKVTYHLDYCFFFTYWSNVIAILCCISIGCNCKQKSPLAFLLQRMMSPVSLVSLSVLKRKTFQRTISRKTNIFHQTLNPNSAKVNPMVLQTWDLPLPMVSLSLEGEMFGFYQLFPFL